MAEGTVDSGGPVPPVPTAGEPSAAGAREWVLHSPSGRLPPVVDDLPLPCAVVTSDDLLRSGERPFQGKRVVVLATTNSDLDFAQDLASSGEVIDLVVWAWRMQEKRASRAGALLPVFHGRPTTMSELDDLATEASRRVGEETTGTLASAEELLIAQGANFR